MLNNASASVWEILRAYRSTIVLVEDGRILGYTRVLLCETCNLMTQDIKIALNEREQNIIICEVTIISKCE